MITLYHVFSILSSVLSQIDIIRYVFWKVWYNLTVNDSFSRWIINELDARDWTQTKLAKEIKTSTSHVSMVLNGQRAVTANFCVSVAKALGVPVVPILELAAIIPRQPQPTDPEAKQLLDVWYRLSEDERRVLLGVLERASH
jgi:transcriptional regulator with XRE-family HTH domain